MRSRRGWPAPSRGSALLKAVHPLNARGEESPAELPQPLQIDLLPGREPVDRITLEFVTPTELKADGNLTDRPEFGHTMILPLSARAAGALE